MSAIGLALLLTVLALGGTMGWVTHWQRKPRPVGGDPRPQDPDAQDLSRRELGPQNLGPQDLGPQNLGPQNLGPQDLGPQDLGPQDLGGQDLGERATLVQFSSAFCAPCRATRVILRGIADRVPGVGHIEIDAESHLDLVRRLGVLRTPTVLILDAHGRTRLRSSGAPRKSDILAALQAIGATDAVETTEAIRVTETTEITETTETAGIAETTRSTEAGKAR